MNIITIISVTLFLSCSARPFNESGQHVKNVFECRSEEPPEAALSGRTFLEDANSQWPMGVVPFVINDGFSDDQKASILKAAQVFSDLTCVRWVPRTDEQYSVVIEPNPEPGDCNSFVGRIEGGTLMTLGEKCFRPDLGYVGAIEHEMMHAMSFIHEHQRLDRNCYIRVDPKKIDNSKIYDYDITNMTADHSFPYDINSIMHYKMPAMEGLYGELGLQVSVPSELDIMKINYLYCGGPSYCQAHPDGCRTDLVICDPS